MAFMHFIRVPVVTVVLIVVVAVIAIIVAAAGVVVDATAAFVVATIAVASGAWRASVINGWFFCCIFPIAACNPSLLEGGWCCSGQQYIVSNWKWSHDCD